MAFFKKSLRHFRLFPVSKIHVFALFILVTLFLKQQTTNVSDTQIFEEDNESPHLYLHLNRRRLRRNRNYYYENLMLQKGDLLKAKERIELDFWVYRYIRWHEANRHNATRVAVFLPVEKAGLGQNVAGMLNLWGYAVITNRLLLINFTYPYPLGNLVSMRTRYEYMYSAQQDSRKFGNIYGGNIRMPTSRSTMWNGVVQLLKGSIPGVGLRVTNSDKPHEFALRDPVLGYKDKDKNPVPEFSPVVKRAITRILLEPSEEILGKVNALLSRQGFNHGLPYFAFHARLGFGIGEGTDSRFASAAIDYEAIARCAAEKLVRMGEKYDISPRSLQVFIATDTPSFRPIFEKAIMNVAPDSNVMSMKENQLQHSSNMGKHTSQVNMHVENIVLGNAIEIIALRSGFSQVAYWRGIARKLSPMYYTFCPHSRKREFEV